VLQTTEDFYGICEVQHQALLPFWHDEAFLERPPSP